MKKKLIALLVAFALITSAAPALAAPTDTDVIFDVLISRPCGFAAIVLGSALFIVSLPVAIPSSSVKTVGRRLVMDPIEFTFIRPVGDFDYKLGTWPQTKDDTQ
jgi:hypothetical protein